MNKLIKRLFDIVASGCGLLVLSPVLLIVAIWIKLDSRGPVFYRQVRVGYKNKDFRIFKFRSMRMGADKGSLVTIGGRDPRITRSGYFIRKYKLDELPQLINVFIGDMSLVGPRPEVRHQRALQAPAHDDRLQGSGLRHKGLPAGVRQIPQRNNPAAAHTPQRRRCLIYYR